MIAPYTLTQLYKREDMPDDVDSRKVEVDYYFERYETDIDLLQIDQTTQGYSDKGRVTNVFFLSGRVITVLVPIQVLRTAIAKARAIQKEEMLLVFRQ